MFEHTAKNHCLTLTGCARRQPRQERGERRVVALLAAAVREFATAGYEAATMSSIAARANAPIGSLYQFFPNKQAVARAVRTRQIEDVERLWAGLKPEPGSDGVAHFVDRFVDLMIMFIDGHPAFLPLLDAPSSTQPVGPRNRLRARLEQMLLALQPGLPSAAAPRIAETVLNINKALMGMCARAQPGERRRIIREYRSVLKGYLTGRLAETGTAARAKRPRHAGVPGARPAVASRSAGRSGRVRAGGAIRES